MKHQPIQNSQMHQYLFQEATNYFSQLSNDFYVNDYVKRHGDILVACFLIDQAKKGPQSTLLEFDDWSFLSEISQQKFSYDVYKAYRKLNTGSTYVNARALTSLEVERLKDKINQFIAMEAQGDLPHTYPLSEMATEYCISKSRDISLLR